MLLGTATRHTITAPVADCVARMLTELPSIDKYTLFAVGYQLLVSANVVTTFTPDRLYPCGNAKVVVSVVGPMVNPLAIKPIMTTASL